MAFYSLFLVRLGYIRLGDCPKGLGKGLEPHPQGLEIGEKLL